MCGRTVCHLAPGDIQSACKYKDKHGKVCEPDWKDAPSGKKYYPSYNIAPGSHTPVLLSSAHFNKNEISTTRVIQPMLWGLVPSWHKGSIGNKAFETNNCRAESMMDKQTYKVPLQKGRRCVILAEGFYEWKRDKTAKQPYYIYSPKKSNKDNMKKEMSVKDENDFSSNPELCETKNVFCESDIKPASLKCEVTTVKCESDSDSISVKCEGEIEMKCESKTMLSKSVKTEYIKEAMNTVKKEPSEISEENEDHMSTLLMMAGVFDVWQPQDGSEPVYSYSVITVESSSAMSWLHHRMPALLTTDSEIEEWLNFGEVPISKAIKLIQPSTHIELHPVSTFVNNARNNSPDCVKKIDPSKPKQTASSNMMMAWLAKGPSPLKKEKSAASSKPDTKRKSGSSSMMMSWLSKGTSPVKTEPPDNNRMKLS